MYLFDLDLLWTAKCSYPPGHVIVEHRHDYYQIIFVHSGDGEVGFEDFPYRAQSNQVYIVKPNVNHGLRASRTKCLNTIELKFHCNNANTRRFIMGLSSHIASADMHIRTLFINIEEELRKKDEYIEEMIKTLMVQILYHLARSLYRGDSEYSGSSKSSYNYAKKNDFNSLSGVIQYIHQNYNEEITLDDLAKVVHLSPIYFCSVFREVYGTSPMQYLQDVRLENAKQLLSNSNESITDIALRVGFQSIHYFSRRFKAYEGVTPSYFRQITQGFIYKDFHGGMTQF